MEGAVCITGATYEVVTGFGAGAATVRVSTLGVGGADAGSVVTTRGVAIGAAYVVVGAA